MIFIVKSELMFGAGGVSQSLSVIFRELWRSGVDLLRSVVGRVTKTA